MRAVPRMRIPKYAIYKFSTYIWLISELIAIPVDKNWESINDCQSQISWNYKVPAA